MLPAKYSLLPIGSILPVLIIYKITTNQTAIHLAEVRTHRRTAMPGANVYGTLEWLVQSLSLTAQDWCGQNA